MNSSDKLKELSDAIQSCERIGKYTKEFYVQYVESLITDGVPDEDVLVVELLRRIYVNNKIEN